MALSDRLDVDPERAWVAGVGTVIAALVLGSIILRDLVWDRFLWHYLWGPVYADAHNAPCAVMTDGGPELVTSPAQCEALAAAGQIVAEPGYTLVSEIVYGVTLLVMLIGVYFLLHRLQVGATRRFLYGLLPFVFFGGALRVVEDALDRAGELSGVVAPLSYPWNTPLISPLIYFTVFFLTLAALLISLRLARHGVVRDYERALAAIGTGLLVLTVGYLFGLTLTTDYVTFHPVISVVVLIGATAVTWLVWTGIEEFAPGINRGTGTLGLVVIWAHMVDAVANVVGIDWGAELGLPYGDLRPKHPVNEAMIGVGEWFSIVVGDILGAVGIEGIDIAHYVGTVWPFLLLKIAAVVVILSLFDERVMEESPRYAVVFLLTVIAVGLGPGTRDMLRATFGI